MLITNFAQIDFSKSSSSCPAHNNVIWDHANSQNNSNCCWAFLAAYFLMPGSDGEIVT